MNISIKRVLCVLLVCLVLCSTCLEPVRADAAAIAAGAVVGLTAPETIAAILIGIGVSYTTYSLFENYVTSISAKIPSNFLIKDSSGTEYIKAVTYKGTVHVPKSLVEWVNNAVWDGCEEVEPVVTPSFTFTGNVSRAIYNNSIQWVKKTYPGEEKKCLNFKNCYTSTGLDENNVRYGICAFTDGTFETFVQDGYLQFRSTSPYCYVFYTSTNYSYHQGNIINIARKVCPVYTVSEARTGEKTYSVADGLIINSSASKDLSDEQLQTWIQTGIWIVELPEESSGGDDGGNDDGNKEKIPYVPVRPGGDIPGSAGQTQAEAQSGNGDIATIIGTDATVKVDENEGTYFEYNGKQVDWPELELSPPPVFETFSIQTIIEFLQWFWQQLLTVLKWIGSCIKLLPMQLVYDLQYCLQWLLGGLSNDLSKLSDSLKPLMDYLLEGIKAIFVPSKDFITAKVQSLRARFDWIDPFIVFAENISGELFSAEPPVIYIHLDDAEGSYNYGGTIPFLDMRWYARYKAQGDLILSGFLWAIFAWRMYLKLPGIISGASGTIGRISSFSRRDDD